MRLHSSTSLLDGRGFTIIELMIVVMIASIVIGIAVPNIQSSFQKRDVEGARNGVMLLAARARARALEQAQTVEFRLDADAAVASVVQGGTTIEAFDFGDDLGVTAVSDQGDIVMCYTSRGFATEPCSTHLSAPARVVFSRAGTARELEIWQLGQVRKP